MALGVSDDASGQMQCDGSTNVNLPITLANSRVIAGTTLSETGIAVGVDGTGTYSTIVVDARGRATAGVGLHAIDEVTGTAAG